MQRLTVEVGADEVNGSKPQESSEAQAGVEASNKLLNRLTSHNNLDFLSMIARSFFKASPSVL